MQRQLSSFDISVIVSELQDITGCIIDKIFQITQNEILLKIKNIKTKEKETIYIRNGELIALTSKDFNSPTKPSTFAMTLRKYLENGKISEITQHEFDRIIKIKILKKEGEFTLIIELFSKGNIILVDPDGNIILPFIRQSWAHRALKGREPYNPPPAQINPFNISEEEFKKLIKESNADIVRTLAININLSGFISEEICARANIDKKLKIESLKDEDIKKIYSLLKDFLKIFKEKKFEPVLVKKEGVIIDILPFKFVIYNGFTLEKIDSYVRNLINIIETKKVIIKKEVGSEKIIGKLNRQLAQQKEAVLRLEKEIEKKNIEGELIYLNYQQCENIINEIKQVLELKDKEYEIKVINKYSIIKNFNPTDNNLILNLKDTKGKNYEVKLDFRKTVPENAEKAYDESKKLKNKQKGAIDSIEKTLEQIKSIKKNIVVEIEKKDVSQKKEKIFWFEHFKWFISSNGNVVIGGKDAKSNELIVKKYLKDGDRYIHADIHGAASCVVKSKGVKDEPLDIPNETLEEACIFAGAHSKAWKQFAVAQVYWVLPEQVSKTAQSGEFVPKGAFIIRGKRNYYQVKLSLAIGLIEIEGQKKVMCGPQSAIKKFTNKYLVIEPENIKKSDLANKIAKAFDVPTESVNRVLPPGGALIVQNIGINLD